MAGNIILIFLTLIASTLVASFILWILLDKKVNFGQTIKLFSIAAALNKMLLTGSGYAAASLKLKGNNFSLVRSLSSFAIFELFSVFPWLISGLYFGAKVSLQIPIFLIVVFALILISIIFKRKEIVNYLKEVLNQFKDTRAGLFLIIPLSIINVALGVIYYFFLFRTFGVNCDLLNVLKIASVSFTLGYLSPFPSGLGVKEGGMIYLLTKHGVSLGRASVIAVIDRLLVSSFYGFMGFLFGARIIKDEIGKRFKR